MKQRTRAIESYFREIQLKYSRFYAQILNAHDLSLPQFALLGELLVSGSIPMTEASCKLHISKPAVTHLVDRLEKKKMLKRTAHPKDRRMELLQITEAGKKAVRKTQSDVLQYLFKTLKQFSAQDQKTIVSFYSSVLKTLDSALSNCKQK